MRLSAITTTTTTAATNKAKRTRTTTEPAKAATATATTALATTTATRGRTKRRRGSVLSQQIECFICNIIHLFLLTTTIICSPSTMASGLNAQSQPEAQTLAAKVAAGRDADATSSGQSYVQQFVVDAATTATAAVAVAVADSHPHSHTHSYSHTHAHTHTHIHTHAHAHTHTATTLRVSYDSNEIDNSYAAEAAAAAAAAAAIVADDDDGDGDGDGDAEMDDVEVLDANDYVMAMGQSANTTNERKDKITTTTTTATTIRTTTASESVAKDLLSLSQLSSNPASIAPHDKSASGLKNSIASSGVGTGVGSGVGATFQQIGSQRVNGNGPTSASTVSQQVPPANGTLATTSSAGADKSNVRHSAKKVDSKFVLPKQQKTDAPMLNYIFDTHSSANKHHHHDQRYGPHFEDVQRVGQPTNMTVQAGSSIHLNCRISLLQDKTVSWVRRNAQSEENALDLLTVGLHAYTGDKRYKMEFQYPNNWRLKIVNVKKDDEATYECQISTHPPRVIQINLHVNAPKVMIVDEYGDPLQEKYYEIDSTLQLSCVVRNVAMTSSVVYWKHADNTLNYDVTRGGVSVKTELMEDGANSTLSIAKINKSDSGNYTCSISEYQNFTIVVHILNGESFAELHHGGAGATPSGTWRYLMGLYVLCILSRWLRTR